MRDHADNRALDVAEVDRPGLRQAEAGRPRELALGYSSPFVAHPGESVQIHVAAEAPSFEASAVRLDTDESHPGLERLWPPRRCDGEPSQSTFGSSLEVGPARAFGEPSSFTVSFWLLPTLATAVPQVIAGTLTADGRRGWQVVVDRDGGLGLRIAVAGVGVAERFAELPLPLSEWSHGVVVCDADRGRVGFFQGSRSSTVRSVWRELAHGEWSSGDLLVFGAPHGRGRRVERDGNGCLNGKLAEPTVFAAAIDQQAVERLRAAGPAAVDAPLVCRLDLADAVGSAEFRDRSPYHHPVRVRNAPTAGVTGPRWSGRDSSFVHDREGHAALHFHDDDLEDAGWEVAFELDIPADLPSGVYAARLETDGHVDRVPFIVTPPGAERGEGIAVLLPTLTYLAYANEHEILSNPPSFKAFTGREAEEAKLTWRDAFVVEEGYLSLYDVHRDGSSVCCASSRRPLLNMRPDYVWPLIGGPHCLGMDLMLLRWLRRAGFPYDVLADQDLDRDGVLALEPYRVVLTGAHPEYWTAKMLDGLQAYLDRGGRLLYLGGNGLCWVTGIDPERPHLVEVRRGQAGSRPSSSAPGESWLTTTGEEGGLWRHRGRGSHGLVGVGTTAMGAGRGRPYKRRPASYEAPYAWVFDGVEGDEIGAEGGVLGGVAGYEFDRADPALGTPAEATVIATASGFAAPYCPLIEDFTGSSPELADAGNPLVRADMVISIRENGGGAFAAGSAAWCGSLLDDEGGPTDVATVTGNVLKRFLETPRGADPLVWGRG
ncbi:MAG: hypothetical protein JSS68_10725 [Actinobacteria bacterium]|nr:hypothetical protein [Actinomycetota bacterium]